MGKKRVISHEAILSTAGSLFREGGYKNTDMRRIAAECGVAVGSLYNYYAGKREIFLAVYQDTLASTHQKVDQIILREDPPKERLVQVLELIYFETLNHFSLWTNKYALDLSDRFLASTAENSDEPEILGLDISLVQKSEHLLQEIKMMDPSDTARLARTLLDSISTCIIVAPENHEDNKEYLRWLVERICS